jgi:ABC-type maltose transport system permease subunit
MKKYTERILNFIMYFILISVSVIVLYNLYNRYMNALSSEEMSSRAKLINEISKHGSFSPDEAKYISNGDSNIYNVLIRYNKDGRKK